MKTKKIPWGNKKASDVDVSEDLGNPYTFLKAFNGKLKLDFSSDAVNKAYSPFIVNRCVSMNPSLVHLANEMNSRIDMPKEIQSAFYMLTYPKKDLGFFPYVKKKKDDAYVEDMNKYYSFGTRDSILAQKLLTDEQVDNITKIFVGGRK